MQRPEWAPDGVDITQPNMARSYDYWLGGSHNFAIDREYARQIMSVLPEVRLIAQANRAFMQRAVRHMLDKGVRQFLDIGSGIPTLGNVHEVAQRIDSDARVVYVDIDPIAVAHSEQLLADNPNGTAVQQDLTQVDEIINHPKVAAMLDFSQPVGLLMVSVLHVVSPQDDPFGKMAMYRDVLAPGSFVAITHATDDHHGEAMNEARKLSQRTPTPGTLRSHAEILRFFDGLDLIDPGLVWVAEWRAEFPDDFSDDGKTTGFYAGVGRKP
jgi:hypothetical protein